MLKAVGHRVLVKFEVETESEGGIIIAQDEKLAKVSTEVGIVVDVGPEAWAASRKLYGDEMSWYPWAKVGDKVLYSKYGGKLIRDPKTQEEFIILNDEDILCKVE